MNEQEWPSYNYAWQMRDFLRSHHRRGRGAKGARRARLVVCGLARQAWIILPDDRLRAGVEIAERHADGEANAAELAKAERRASPVGDWGAFPHLGREFALGALELYRATQAAKAALRADSWEALKWATNSDWCSDTWFDLARDIFGNPFGRLPKIVPAWRTPLTRSMTQTIYEEHRFGDLPILADALEEAGCTDADILAHCRGSGPHVRGCWVIDLLLGKG
jgi:hypothetical protein